MRDKKLLSVTVVLDDETGCYEPGELDYGVPYDTKDWLMIPGNREKLASELEDLARQCRASEGPFRPPFDSSTIGVGRSDEG